MPVRLIDIAEKLSMDKGTVSRILRGDPRAETFRPETREKVLALARKLGYRRNLSAATISMGVNASTVAIISEPGMPDSMMNMFDIIAALNHEQKAARIFCGNNLEEIFADIASNQIPYVACGRYLYSDRLKCAALARKYGLRMLFLNAVQEFPDFPVFDSDNMGIMVQMVDYLYAIGHRRIVFYCGDHSKGSTFCRHNGFLNGLKKYNLPFEANMTVCDEYSEAKLFHCLRCCAPTAICAIDPTTALWIESSLERNGIRVPKDISLISYGNNPILWRHAFPRITAFRETPVPLRTRDIFEYLFHCDSKRAASSYTRFYPATLCERESTSAPDPSSELSERILHIKNVRNTNTERLDYEN